MWSVISIINKKLNKVSMIAQFLVSFITSETMPWGYAIQYIPVLVPSQDKLGGLRQEGHLA